MSTTLKPESMNVVSQGPKGPFTFGDVAVRLTEGDHVAIAKQSLLPGTMLTMPDGSELRIAGMVPVGHKFALTRSRSGDPVIRYGQQIGFATQDIDPGQHVHTQNLTIKDMGSLTLDYAFCEDYQPVELVPEPQRRTFMGFKRADGRVGTRNYRRGAGIRQLLVVRDRRDCRPFPPARRARRLSRTSTA